MDELIENKVASAPPFNDQVTVSLAENVSILIIFSLIVFMLVEDPDPPEGPIIIGLTVSILRVTVLLASDPSLLVLPAESENFDEETLITPFVVLSAVGVNVAV